MPAWRTNTRDPKTAADVGGVGRASVHVHVAIDSVLPCLWMHGTHPNGATALPPRLLWLAGSRAQARPGQGGGFRGRGEGRVGSRHQAGVVPSPRHALAINQHVHDDLSQTPRPPWRCGPPPPQTTNRPPPPRQPARQELERTVLGLLPDSELARVESYPFGEYRAFLVPSAFGRDVLEFLVKPEFQDRGWEGDASSSGTAFVTFRSLAGRAGG